MSSLAKNNIDLDFKASKVWLTDDSLYVRLVDGREVKVPLDYYPRLKKASRQDRETFEIFGEGSAIRWPTLDEDLSVEGIVLGISARQD